MVQLEDSPPQGDLVVDELPDSPLERKKRVCLNDLQNGIQSAQNDLQMRENSLATALQESLKENFGLKALAGLTAIPRSGLSRSDVSTSSGASPNNTTTDEELSDIASNSSVDGRITDGSVSPSARPQQDILDSPESSGEISSSGSFSGPRDYLTQELLGSALRPGHEKRHICDICGKGFPYLSILESHKRCHTGEKPFSCHFCDKKFAQKATLQVHERTHTGERPYKCRYCEKTFAQYGTKTVHEKSAHLGIRNYKCPLCEKSLSSPSALYTHKKTHGDKVFKCDFCTKTFTLKNYLKLHVKQVHEQTERKHICSYCHKSFAYAGSLQVHVRTHTGERPYICRFCPKSFASQGNLQSHERTHTGERPYSCGSCGRSFIQKSQLTAHEATHLLGGEDSESPDPNGNSALKATVVTGTSSASSNLPSPITSSQPGDHKCKYCGKRYLYASSLYVHYRTHTGQRPFRCTYCDKTFTNQGNMQVHQRVHTGEKPYKCKGCDKSYAQKVGLKIHQESCQMYKINENVRSSESPINVETDSDCGSEGSSVVQKTLDMFLPNIYAKSYDTPSHPNLSSFPFNLHLNGGSSSASSGFVPPPLPLRAPEVPPPDFGPMAGSKPPFQPEMSMPESLSAFHAPGSAAHMPEASLGGTPTGLPSTPLPHTPTLGLDTSNLLASLLGAQLPNLASLSQLQAQHPQLQMPQLNATQLLNTQQLLLQMQQNQTDQLVSQLLAGIHQVPNLFAPLGQQFNPLSQLNLPAPQPTYVQPLKPEPVLPSLVKPDGMLA